MDSVYRVPTHKASKATFTPEDITMAGLISAHPKTVSPLGAKEVDVIHPPGDKEGFTILLTIQANGGKFPAVIVFKGAKKTDRLSDQILKLLILPGNVIV
ncbi:hypothetical protein BV898_15275 [Hypsibius exemplaris]|uniref:Uncharacterized protein n=1 Tax=Hypsibius exemplaris TaxID=2072580 RepID=A0A9X6NJY9_HYPEX|nr:hypothetical protein BV898_15275 [Hypsibius exemplaris]